MSIASGKVLAFFVIAQTMLFAGGINSQSSQGQCSLEQHARWIGICLTKRPHHSDCAGDFRSDPLCWFQGQGANDVCFMPGDAKSFEKEVLASCPELTGAAATADCLLKEHVVWLRGCIAKATSLKPGMHRRDIGATFHQDGGMSTRTAARYLIEGCPGFKIRVEFTPSQQIGESNDLIKSVSKPYLGRGAAD